MITIIGYSGNETDAECKELAWAMFCRAHPVEAYAHDPEGFWRIFHAQEPNVTREQMAALLKECEEEPGGVEN